MTDWAPWVLVGGDSKRYARVKVIETVIAATEAGLERHGRRSAPGEVDGSGAGRYTTPGNPSGEGPLARAVSRRDHILGG